MRKYFLLSAVALLATSTANAKTDYAEVTARATIEVAGTFTCEDMDFGTIVMKQGNEELTILDAENRESHPDVISVSGNGISSCTGGYLGDDEEVLDAPIKGIVLKNENNNTITLDVWPYYGNLTAGVLNIPANVKAGTYTGSYTIVTVQP